jgi:hypothetical protein
MAPHLYCVAFLLLVGCVGTQAQRLATVLEHVDPFIGTGGNGFGYGRLSSLVPNIQTLFGVAYCLICDFWCPQQIKRPTRLIVLLARILINCTPLGLDPTYLVLKDLLVWLECLLTL